MPISVSAGLFESIGNLFSRVSAKESLQNRVDVYNMPLLVAAVTPSGTGYEDGRIVDDVALSVSSGPAGNVPTTVHKSYSDQISVYIVREGDTLSQIAEMFNVSVNTIKWSNDLGSNTLKEGDTLVILPITGVRHPVAKGDTLASIAKKYNADIDEIAAYNNLDKNGALALGTEVIVPDGEVQAVPKSSSSVSVPKSSGLKEVVGYYTRPIVGGKRTQGIHGYNGVDLAAPVGTPIYAAAAGEVIISRATGWNGGYGAYIVIKHENGTQTLYAHNSQNSVSAGDYVSQGDIIGRVGATGKATGSHLHFEIRGAKNPF